MRCPTNASLASVLKAPAEDPGRPRKTSENEPPVPAITSTTVPASPGNSSPGKLLFFSPGQSSLFATPSSDVGSLLMSDDPHDEIYQDNAAAFASALSEVWPFGWLDDDDDPPRTNPAPLKTSAQPQYPPSGAQSIDSAMSTRDGRRYSKVLRINKSEPLVHIKCAIQNLYVFKEKIGVGSWGVVHLAVERSSGFLRAIKKIPKRANIDLKRFRQEMTILSGFDHPRVVRLYETFEDYSTLYMVMEYCRGGELFHRMAQEKALPEPAAAWIMRDVLSSIAYCHSKGVCHRDIKPENFMFLDRDIRSPLKLIDFGLAKRFRLSEPLTSRVGTVHYLAPELQDATYNHKVDLWSAGVMMFSMLFGYAPFSREGLSDRDVLHAIKTQPIDCSGVPLSFNTSGCNSPSNRRAISFEAENLIRSLCAKNPDDRPEAAAALAHGWFALQFPSPLRHIPSLRNLQPRTPRNSSSTPNTPRRTVASFRAHAIPQYNQLYDPTTRQRQRSLPALRPNSIGMGPPTTSLPKLFCCDFMEIGCGRHSRKCRTLSNSTVTVPGSFATELQRASTSPAASCPQDAAVQLLAKLGLHSASDAAAFARKLFSKLEHFARLSPLKRGLLSLAAQQLEPHVRELSYIQTIFDLLDTGRDGVLTYEEFLTSFSALLKGGEEDATPHEIGDELETGSVTDRDISMEELRSLLGRLDLDGDGVVEYSDFVAACLDQSTYRHPAAGKAVFRVLDRDMDNKIGLNELKLALGWNRFDEQSDVTERIDGDESECQFVGRLLSEADADCDGFIGREDLTALLAKEEEGDQQAGCLFRVDESIGLNLQLSPQCPSFSNSPLPVLSQLPSCPDIPEEDQFDFSAVTKRVIEFKKPPATTPTVPCL